MPSVHSTHILRGGLFRPKVKISGKAINHAVQTVRVKSVGNRWSVKKVAAPKIWFFLNPDKAVAKAIELAAPDKWRVVVHDGGKITKIILPNEFTRPVVDFGLKRKFSRPSHVRQNRRNIVAAPLPA